MFKYKKMVLDLVRRREEVLKRAGMIVSGNIPDKLILYGRMPDYFMWVIGPHVYKEWTAYVEESAESYRKRIDTKLKEIIEEDENEEKIEQETTKNKSRNVR